MFLTVVVIRAISSANLSSERFSPSIFKPLSSSSIFLKASWIVAVNNFGDRGSPCLTPFSIFISSDTCSFM